MRFILCCTVLVCALMPASAGALERDGVVLGFGDSYSTSAGETRVHRGVDLALAADEPVTAPAEGDVAFAGRVPGPEGGTVLAVSLDTAQGRVTLMPLSALDVRAGTRVDAGDPVGRLAGTGDPSSLAPHVHVSLRSGELYLDPAALFTVVAPSPSPDPAPVEVEAPAEAPSAGVGTAVVAAPASASTPAAAGAPAVEIGVASDPAPAAQPAPAPASASAVTEVGDALQPGVALAPTLASASAPVAARPDVLSVVSRLAGGLAANPLGLACVVAAVLVLGFVLTRRSLERKMCSRPSVSDRLGKMLQQLRAGDTLCGLNSCPGHDAFTVPGPPAQRR